MNLEEARKVLWPDKHHRPMGELFDIGFLYRQKLVWAADHASDPRVRDAARLFLGILGKNSQGAATKGSEAAATASKAFELGITLEQARRKPWPFPPHKGRPVGELSDQGVLTLKDLGYAAENAWDEGVRKSAMALMLERMDQILKEPPPTDGPVEVISGGRSYAQAEETRLTLIQGMIFGLAMGLAIAFAVWATGNFNAHRSTARPFIELFTTPVGNMALVTMAVMTAILAWFFFGLPDMLDRRLQKHIEEHRRGQEGEDRAVQVILQALDGTWKVFRNAQVPGMKRSDIDIVLVGPPGVWALEVKNLRGEYRNVGDNWEYRHGKVWKESRAQPSQEARSHAAALGGFLKADGLNVFANPAVVWANAEASLTVDNPSVVVWTLDRLADELGNIWHSKQMPAPTKQRITEKLTRLCAAVRSK